MGVVLGVAARGPVTRKIRLFCSCGSSALKRVAWSTEAAVLCQASAILPGFDLLWLPSREVQGPRVGPYSLFCRV